METMSVNGKLIPIGGGDITDEYTGHFLKVSFTQEIAGHAVFNKDRVEVSGDGSFRFYVPKKELLVDEMVIVEGFSPDGEMVGRQNYSYGSLAASAISVSAEDDSKLLEIAIDPKIIVFNAESPAEESSKKISGKVIDLSGEKKTAGLQVIIMVTDDPLLEYDSQAYKPVFSAMTDKNGYFYGRVVNKSIQKAFGIITGVEDQPIIISLENNKIPKNILLVSDLSNLPEGTDCGCNDAIPGLPDNEDLVNSTAFSQDIGGTCVDFTIPNRTLEEFSFYHTVRTTEPEIKGLTITAKASSNIKNELVDISNNIFAVVGRLKNSFNSLSLLPFTIEDDAAVGTTDSHVMSRVSSVDSNMQVTKGFPNYVLKMDIGSTKKFSLNSNDLIMANNTFVYADLIKIILEQRKRQQKLLELQQKLAAAYCGKKGVEDVKSFCETIASQDHLNREGIATSIREMKRISDSLKMDLTTDAEFHSVLFEIEKFITVKGINSKALEKLSAKLDALIKMIEKNASESPQKEVMLSHLRKLAIEFIKQTNSELSFEPCPPSEKTQTMGIMCLIQKYRDIKETLRNTSIFSLSEILEIRAYYDVFLESITTFLELLDEYHAFYNSGANFTAELNDDYFFQNYEEIKSTLTALKRQIYRAIIKVEEIERAYILNHPGRVNLSVENSIDWDETPTIYENTTIAHGHILHFKQKWKADGYSLGDLLYSLPLAPCQEKQIAIVDWDRKEQNARVESQTVSEELQADISRDRDITEIMNSSLNESINATSTNKTSSTSAGIGGGLGGFISPIAFGIAGGVSHSGASSRSTATQNSSRNAAASSLNRLQDSTSQSASSLRSQRNTVIQTVGQNESVSVQTEVIKNNNHCHAMTVEYFEVLKHYAIEQKLADVQECLFVPMPMSHFDHKKVMRWRNTLQKSVYGQKLRRGFDAIERIESNYVNSDLPIGSYADEVIEEFSGHFTISFELERPFIKTIDEATKTEEYDLSIPFPWFFGKMVFHLEREVPLTEQEKDAIFEEQYVPNIVRKFVDRLQVDAISDDGREEQLDLDVTLLSNYRKGAALKVSVASKSPQNITRKQIKHLRFRANTDVKPTSKIILRSTYLSYKTKHLNEYIVRNSRVNNDIINSSLLGGLIQFTDAALMYTPLNNKELRNPRKEDQDAASALVGFLNEHMEMAHKVIWSSIDSSRLFGLLDGFIAPNSGSRSVASVVENKVMGIVGNNLVLKVVPGERLDPVFRGVEELFDYYKPTTTPDPFRVSVPTKGVYAESVMGKCNSCEEIDETRHWRFSDEPCGTKATSIEPVSTASRRSDPGDLQVKDLPSNIINMQTAPTAPDPTGLAAAYGLLGKGDAFKDFTGLAGTQANALGALQTTSKSVTDLAGISKDFASLAVMANQKKDGAKQIEQIKKLNKEGYLTDKETSEQIKNVLGSYNDAAKNLTKSKESDEKSVANKIASKVVTQGLNSPDQQVEYNKTNPDGESESIKVSSPTQSKKDSSKPIIFLTGSTASAEHRAFNPATGDKTLIIEVGADFSNAPEGSKLRWSSPTAGVLVIDNPNAKKTQVRGIKPGKHDLDVSLLDSGGNSIATMKLKLSVPQCVTVVEDAALFDAALSSIHLAGQKNTIVNEMKGVVEHLLSKANVRVFWQLGGHSETVPAHVTAANTIVATVKNKDPSGVLGETSGPAAGDSFNETINIFPGAYSEPDDIDVDTETQALIQQLELSISSDDDLIPIGSKIYGRLLGETLSHEIGHALLWDDIPGSGHNSPKKDNDLMNQGVDREFIQRTGMENTVQTSPVSPDDYVDHGLAKIGGFQAVNQALIDSQWPVPPAHG